MQVCTCFADFFPSQHVSSGRPTLAPFLNHHPLSIPPRHPRDASLSPSSATCAASCHLCGIREGFSWTAGPRAHAAKASEHMQQDRNAGQISFSGNPPPESHYFIAFAVIWEEIHRRMDASVLAEAPSFRSRLPPEVLHADGRRAPDSLRRRCPGVRTCGCFHTEMVERGSNWGETTENMHSNTRINDYWVRH